MTRRSKEESAGRRDFLKGVAAAGGAAAAVAAGGAVAAPDSEPTAAPEVRGTKGYRVTPHIAEYYEKARF